MLSLVILAVLTLGVSPVICEEHVRSKRQANIACDEDRETEIITAFLYTDTATCPQLIGGISDWYNEDFREECARWLNLENIPREVAQTYVSECHQFDNGTTKYRTKICCSGKPNVPSENQLMCFTCAGDSLQYEPNVGYYHTQHCNHFAHNGTGPEVCAAGEVCAVEMYFNRTYSSLGIVSKSCMEASRCSSLQEQNPYTCRSRLEPYCAYCYNETYGNYDHPMTRPRVRGPCEWPCYSPGTEKCVSNGTEIGDPYTCICRPEWSGTTCNQAAPCVRNPCYNGGTCVVTHNNGTDGYTCLCRPPYSGSHCTTTQCHSGPCDNGAVCSVKNDPPYYFCRCRLAWTGYNCSESASQCTVEWCKNNGTCYVQGSDQRCLCPSGYVGKSCEYSRPYDCGEESERRSYHRTENLYTDSYDCTAYNDNYIQGYINYPSVSDCFNYLRSRFGYSRPLYRPGVNGEHITSNEAVVATRCEQGRDYTWGAYKVCCPSCGSNPCQNGGWCIQRSNSFTCRCRFNYAGRFCEKKLSSCYAAGDPHYYTFDGVRMHYQGSCKYIMTQGQTPDNQTSFRVTTKNERRDGSPHFVTYPKYAEIEVNDTTIKLAKNNKAYVDGILIGRLPYTDNSTFSIAFNGLKLRFETVFGLVVEFSRNWIIIVRVPADVAGQVDGLCRDFNGIAPDDFVMPDGQDVTNDENRDNIIGNYFQTLDPEEPNCPSVIDPGPVCDDATTTTIKSNAYCGLIEDTSGPFAQCISSAPDNMVEIYMENCIYDVCAVYNSGEDARKEAKCGSLEAFAEVCMSDSSFPSLTWRDTAGCVPECESDLGFDPSTTACRVTCANPFPSKCNLPDTANCICERDTDVVLDDGTCAHASVCGCYEEGREIGEVWCNEDSTVTYECVNCTECERPIGKVVSSQVTDPAAQCPACDGVTCQNGGECVQDGSRQSGYRCDCCSKWSGEHCEVPNRFNCGANNNPCTDENMNNYLCPDNPTVYFAHDNLGKYVQCGWGQCFDMPCPAGLEWDVALNACDFP